MWKIYKTVGVLAIFSVLIGLFVSFKSPSSVTETQPNSAMTETSSQHTAELQPTPSGQDPFKTFLDQKTGSSNTVSNSDNAQSIPTQAGKDPFKEFLDKQKQNSKDQVASPFGKN
jgi:type III secretory pathway component EscR